MSRAQWTIVFISGMGFFTDAYDLFIIGVVLKMLHGEWHLGAFEMALVGATALVSAAIGSVLFGRIADVYGRKYIYGFEVLVLGAGAVASAFSPNIWWLVAFRFILGLGIGGDYPVSATIASEFAGRSTRGFMISSVFAMQGIGLIVGPLLAIMLITAHVPEWLVWRILLAAGAVPPLAVFWARRHLQETPRFTQLTQANESDELAKQTRRVGFVAAMREAFGKDAQLRTWLLGTSLAWFFLDLAYYGNTISNQAFVTTVDPHGDAVHDLLVSLFVFAFAAFPGYVLAVFGMDRWGRKRIQLLGFTLMAASFGSIAVLGAARYLLPFIALYCINYFFTEFGPNTTTFVLPAEIFPAQVRTTSHGLSATVGKLGAAVGTFGFPLLQARFGLPGPMLVAAASCVVGMAVTHAWLPEPKGLGLEEASRDTHLVQPAPQASRNTSGTYSFDG